MKKSVLITAIVLKAVLGLVSCDSENLDNERPVVKVILPSEDELVIPGSDIHFEVEMSDNAALSSYKVNIHGAFDGHGHGEALSATTRAASDSVEFSRTWLESDFIALGEEPISGKTKVSVKHHHMKIPASVTRTIDGEQKEMPLKEGHYHFIVYCTDEAGQESFASKEIFISYDAEGHNHN
ncbi:MAG: DUF4625 domain-containing protein [Fermentimonas sp.]|nr:DUF4625 domain-containing protein [Fermentimonas sp.]MBF6597970.1 DUF4625 domain-containing protein [Fermentimonas sp.]